MVSLLESLCFFLFYFTTSSSFAWRISRIAKWVRRESLFSEPQASVESLIQKFNIFLILPVSVLSVYGMILLWNGELFICTVKLVIIGFQFWGPLRDTLL